MPSGGDDVARLGRAAMGRWEPTRLVHRRAARGVREGPGRVGRVGEGGGGDDGGGNATTPDDRPRRHTSLYDDPKLYELAFGHQRDFAAEVGFLRAVAARHGVGTRARRLLELGAGPAWHSTAWAEADPSAVAVAVDNSRTMTRRARARAALLGVSNRVCVVDADMTAMDPAALRRAAAGARSSSIPAGLGFDVACVLLGTAAHLLETDEVLACLAGMRACLAPGGVAVLELEHPFDLFEGTLMDAYGDGGWSQEVPPGVRVNVEWGREGDRFDVATHVVHRTVGVEVVDPTTGRRVPGWGWTEEVVPYRVFTAPEVDALARLAGLRTVGLYGDMDARSFVPLDDERAHNMVVVLKKDEDG